MSGTELQSPFLVYLWVSLDSENSSQYKESKDIVIETEGRSEPWKREIFLCLVSITQTTPRQSIADERAGGPVIVFKSWPELEGREKPHQPGLKVEDGQTVEAEPDKDSARHSPDAGSRDSSDSRGKHSRDRGNARRSTTLEGSSRLPDSPGIKEGSLGWVEVIRSLANPMRKVKLRLSGQEKGHYDNSSPGGSHPISSSAVALAGQAVRKDLILLLSALRPTQMNVHRRLSPPQGGISL
ncbi:hypothetical protein BDZ89DRAFT_1053240 [Hymenopellis radicata]|nr:hypothetical protein BDZ89DRAFT_1053240 [Hymenopellis radicata]